MMWLLFAFYLSTDIDNISQFVKELVRLKFAAMNLKKLANWAWKRLCLQAFGKYFWIFEAADGCCAA